MGQAHSLLLDSPPVKHSSTGSLSALSPLSVLSLPSNSSPLSKMNPSAAEPKGSSPPPPQESFSNQSQAPNMNPSNIDNTLLDVITPNEDDEDVIPYNIRQPPVDHEPAMKKMRFGTPINQVDVGPSIMSPAASFVTLPNELIANIVTDPCLRKEDIIALRYTCKLTYAFATEVFAKRYFTKLRILLSPYSLNAMREICAHPGIGPWVRGVIMPSFRIDAGALVTFKNHALGGADDRYHSAPIGPVSIMKVCDELQACIARYRYEVDLLENDKAVKELTSSFKILAGYGNPIKIAVSDVEKGYIGFKKSYGKSNEYSSDRLFVVNRQVALKTLIAGASRSTCKINELSILNNHILSNRSFTTPESLKVKIDILDGHENQPFWRNLETARFRFCEKPDNHSKRKMANIVSWATNLQNLVYSEDQSTVAFEHVVTSVRSCFLEQILLQGFAVKEPSLIQLLTRSRASISHLTFLQGKLMSGSWRFLMSWIKDNLPRLVYLEVLMLSHMKGKTLVKPRKVFMGKTNVQAGLRSLLLEDLA